MNITCSSYPCSPTISASGSCTYYVDGSKQKVLRPFTASESPISPLGRMISGHPYLLTEEVIKLWHKPLKRIGSTYVGSISLTFNQWQNWECVSPPWIDSNVERSFSIIWLCGLTIPMLFSRQIYSHHSLRSRGSILILNL